jgi:hypothetical protein
MYCVNSKPIAFSLRSFFNVAATCWLGKHESNFQLHRLPSQARVPKSESESCLSRVESEFESNSVRLESESNKIGTRVPRLDSPSLVIRTSSMQILRLSFSTLLTKDSLLCLSLFIEQIVCNIPMFCFRRIFLASIFTKVNSKHTTKTVLLYILSATTADSIHIHTEGQSA